LQFVTPRFTKHKINDLKFQLNHTKEEGMYAQILGMVGDALMPNDLTKCSAPYEHQKIQLW
jgi:hypothetical protein